MNHSQENFKIFIGCPTDLNSEKEKVKRAIAEWNKATKMEDRKPSFTVVDSSTVAPSLNRAQAEINKQLRDCNFCIILFKQKWGSEPNNGGPYSSGTEEEFYTSLLSILDEASPMTNSAVLFVKTSNPSPEVEAFKKKLKDSFRIFYGSVTNSKLEEKIIQLLQSFLDRPADEIPDNIPTSRGVNVIGPFKKMNDAKTIISLGDTARGYQLLKSAATDGGPLQQVELAKYYRRSGQYDRAAHILSEICWPNLVRQDRLNSAVAATVLRELSNIDLNRNDPDSVVLRNSQYFSIFSNQEIEAPREYAELLDCSGRAYHQLKQRKKARSYYEKAKVLREKLRDPEQTMRSIINLARLDLKDRNYESLNERLFEADSIEDTGISTPTLANLQLLRAQTSLYRDQDFEKTLEFAIRALRANEFEANEKGIAYSLMLMTEAEIGLGRMNMAQMHAERGLEINDQIKNTFGATKFRTLLAQISRCS